MTSVEELPAGGDGAFSVELRLTSVPERERGLLRRIVEDGTPAAPHPGPRPVDLGLSQSDG